MSSGIPSQLEMGLNGRRQRFHWLEFSWAWTVYLERDFIYSKAQLAMEQKRCKMRSWDVSYCRSYLQFMLIVFEKQNTLCACNYLFTEAKKLNFCCKTRRVILFYIFKGNWVIVFNCIICVTTSYSWIVKNLSFRKHSRMISKKSKLYENKVQWNGKKLLWIGGLRICLG